MSNRTEMTQRILARDAGPLCGIYVITHRASGKCYVGQSVDIVRRWKDHQSSREDTRLSRAVRKHGRAAFAWEIVELCDPVELDEREMYYISAWGFDTADGRGYNLTYGGDGVDMTPENRARLSQAMRESPRCRAAIQRLARDPQWREKQAAGAKRVACDPEWLAKTTAANRHRCADQTVYTLEHVATGTIERGKRHELRERLALHEARLRDLIHGKQKTTKGYRLAGPQSAPASQP